MTEQTTDTARPNGFAAHEAIRLIRGASRTLNDFFGLDPEESVFFHVAAPGTSWYRHGNYLQFLDCSQMRVSEQNLDALKDAMLSRWFVTEEHRRGDLVHFRLVEDAWEIHYIIYADAEVRNPVTLELIKELEELRTPKGPPTVHRIREDIATGRRSWIHLWFTGRDSEHEVKDGTGLPWFIHNQHLYVKHDLDAIMTWTRLDLQQEHRKAGLVYLRSSHPLNADELIAIHCEQNEVHDDAIKKKAREEGDLNEGD